MFTSLSDIKVELIKCGIYPQSIHYIDKGVMTDKYCFQNNGIKYIIRCFPAGREWLAKAEYKYLELFFRLGIKSPSPYLYHEGKVSFLIYEKLPGVPLSDIITSLSITQIKNLCKEIINNYNRIADIYTYGYGKMSGYDSFKSMSWSDFLHHEILQTLSISKNKGDVLMSQVCIKMLEIVKELPSMNPQLVWSDFSNENIIVDEDGEFSGFIDFEGLMSGDPRLGLGYLIAHEGLTPCVNELFNAYGISIEDPAIDFYSIFRICRIYPYAELPLPNGNFRNRLIDYFQYSFKRMSNILGYE